MAGEKVFKPEVIQDTPFPNEVEMGGGTATTPSSGDSHKPGKVPSQGFPTQKIAVELLSSALNTKSKRVLQSFTLEEAGGFQIGKYTPGVSGDLRITPNGITARDSAGITTFAIDGSTGNAVFKGTIQAQSLIAGMVDVGNNRVVIDGDNRRILINDGTNDRILIGYHKDGFS